MSKPVQPKSMQFPFQYLTCLILLQKLLYLLQQTCLNDMLAKPMQTLPGPARVHITFLTESCLRGC